MTIATEKLKQSIFKRQLIRIEHARNISPSLTHIGSNLWQYSYGQAVAHAGVRYNRSKTTMVEDSSYPPAAPGGGLIHYYVDETTGTVTINVGQSTALNQDTQVFISSVYLFFTQVEPAALPEDPEDDTTPIRNWEARIMIAPGSRQTQRNIIEGLVTYDNTSFTLANADGFFQPYFGDLDTFKNAPCLIWEYIADLSNISRVYNGKIAAARIESQTLTFSIFEALYDLKSQADFGLGNDFISLGPNQGAGFAGHALRRAYAFIAERSFYEDQKITSEFNNPSVTQDVYDVIRGVPSKGCTSNSATFTTSSHRTWEMGFVYGSLKTQAFGAIQAFVDVDRTSIVGGYTESVRYIRFASVSNVYLGDTVSWVEGVTTYYAIIVGVGTFTYLGNNYNLQLSYFDNPSAGAFNAFTTGSTMVAKKSFGLFASGMGEPGNDPLKTQSGILPLWSGKDFTLNETVVADFTWLTITLANNFENFKPLAESFRPTTCDLTWTASSAADTLHGSVVGFLLDSAGIDVNAASITAANSALTDKVAFSVPGLDEGDIGTYESYVSRLLRSTLSYLSVTENQEVAYKLFAAPSSTDVRDDDVILFDSLKVDVNYQDIVTYIRFFNPHLPLGQSYSAVTESRLAAAALNNQTTKMEFQHVLALNGSSQIGRQDAIADVLSRRRVSYSYDTRSMDIDALIGDDKRIESTQVLGGSGAKSVKLTSIERSDDSVSVTGIDLLGL